MSESKQRASHPPRKRGLFAAIFEPSDEQAMRRVQTEGDEEALTQLVARWHDPIFRLCARMTNDLSRAEDLTQEVFTKLFRRSHEYKPQAKFSTWLWRVALNHCYDDLRRIKRRGEMSLDEDLDGSVEIPALDLAPDAQLAAEEECDLVRRGLQRLSENSRTVLILRYCEGLKLREISEILDLPETTIHSRIAVALTQITRILEPQFRDEPAARPRAKQFPQAVI